MHSTSLVNHGEACSEWNLQLSFRVFAVLSKPRPSLCIATIHFIQTLKEFFALRCHVKLLPTSMCEWESDNARFNTPALLSHLGSCNTNKSHNTREGKWLIGHNLNVFSSGCTHFCCQRFRHLWLCVLILRGQQIYTVIQDAH
ncbi:hypothetical protein XENORESO_005479 [Xenotaenia resolanae]|uniref:Uncharacterized protein n=1 Tax=Xenotaenia resolanae TaxID=208358 RepID=A0ABV0W716_9TELE